MEEDIIREAIRNPSSEGASGIMSDITPDILKDTMPGIFHQLDSGQSSEVLANETVGRILDVVEGKVLGDATNTVFDNFGDRIFDMIVNGAFLHLLEKVTLLFS